MKYLFCFFVAGLVHCVVFSQSLSLNGENYLVLNGERFKNQKIRFTGAAGDWFATPKDAHGTLSFYGNYEGRNLTLEIEWDGRNEPHIITNEIRHDGKRTGDFIITMSDKSVYGDGLNAYPDGDEEIRIHIQKMDETLANGEISGVIQQGRDKVNVTGVFNLKKNGIQKRIAGSTYKDCDNVIHDKLIGAEGRSPSECEAKYDLDVRTAIEDALLPVIDKFKGDGWEIDRQTSLEPLFIVPRGSEKDIFNTTYELKLKLGPSSPVYADYARKFNDYSDKLKDASKESFDQFVKFSREMNGAINSNIHFSVNNHSRSFTNFKGGAAISRLSNKVYIIQSGYVQATTGGDEGASVDATFLLIGNWKQPVIENLGDGSEEVKATAILNPTASHLQVQNIFVRMECSASVAKEIIKNLDLKKLEALTGNPDK